MKTKLPTFPDREPLSIEHLTRIRNHVSRWPSYSDFNPVSLWTWNAGGNFRVAEFRGNLVIEFGDYLTGERFLSVIGDNELRVTIDGLLTASQTESDLADELRLVPESVVSRLEDCSGLTIVTDDAARDYLYEPSRYLSLTGRSYQRLRGKLNRLRTSAGDHDLSVRVYLGSELKDIGPCLVRVCEDWTHGSTTGVADAAEERRALDCLFRTATILANASDLRVLVASDRHGIHGFVVSEVLPDQTAVGHFLKSDGKLPELSSLLFVEAMSDLAKLDIHCWNCEQDLGLPGLRQYKLLLRPSGFLNKYTIRSENRGG